MHHYRRDPELVDRNAGSVGTKLGNAALPSPFFKAPSMNLHVPSKMPLLFPTAENKAIHIKGGSKGSDAGGTDGELLEGVGRKTGR